jgi:predicted GNAT family acetyltransferase
MIRLLKEADRWQTLELLIREPAFNLFLIGDIENYGMAAPFQQVWGDFDSRGLLQAVLLRYYNSFLAYAPNHCDLRGFARTIRKQMRAEILSGHAETIERFQPLLGGGRLKQTHYAELPNTAASLTLSPSFQPLSPSLLPPPTTDASQAMPRKATLADVPAIFALKRQIAEFRLVPTAEESFRRALSIGAGRSYLIWANGKVVSIASTTAENSRSAMVVGVCTHPDYRRQGLATACIQALCRELLNEGKLLCLFYDNPQAGSIYRRLGFRELGKWGMLYPNFFRK